MSFGLLVLLVVVGTTIWVGVDASKRDWSGGSGAVTWVIGCVLLWIVVFPIYLAKRGRAPLKDPPAGPAAPPQGARYRECPHCKEPMRRDAEICPHCRQPSPPWRFQFKRSHPASPTREPSRRGRFRRTGTPRSTEHIESAFFAADLRHAGNGAISFDHGVARSSRT